MNKNVLFSVNNDINYLMHSGRKGQKKGVFGASGATRYQKQAVYAKTTPNPNEKESSEKGIGKSSAKSKAKDDAAMYNHLNNEYAGNKGDRRLYIKRRLHNALFGQIGASTVPGTSEVSKAILALGMSASADKSYMKELSKGYDSRVKKHKFGKMTKEEINLYKDTYGKYLDKYSKRTLLPYRSMPVGLVSAIDALNDAYGKNK